VGPLEILGIAAGAITFLSLVGIWLGWRTREKQGQLKERDKHHKDHAKARRTFDDALDREMEEGRLGRRVRRWMRKR
jgi:hypothetical protein